MSELERLRAIVGAMRELGVVRCRLEGVEVELGPSAGASSEPLDVFRSLQAEDDALMWSAPGPLPSEIRDAAKPPQE